MADTDDRVELTELDVIARYSLAVRTATASRADLIATLRSDLTWLEGSRSRRGPSSSSRTPSAPTSPPTSADPAAKKPAASVRTSPAKSTARKPAPARKTTAKKMAKKTATKTARRR